MRIEKQCSISKVAIFPRYWAPFGDWSVHQWVPTWSWRTNLGPFETLGSPPRTLTRPSGDPADPQKQGYFLTNIDTFGIEHISSTHVCEFKKMLNLKSSHIPQVMGPFWRLVCPPMGPKLVLEDELGTFRDPRETPIDWSVHQWVPNWS